MKRFIEVLPPNFAEHKLSLTMIERLVAVCISQSLLINWIYIWPKGGWKKKNASFIVSLTNQCT